MFKGVSYIMAAGLLAAAIVPAGAAVTTVASQANFNLLGTIDQSTSFEFLGTGWTYPVSPYVLGNLSFTSGTQMLIGGQDAYGYTRALATDNYSTDVTVQVDGAYNLFAFNAGNFYGAGLSHITVATNLGSYNFADALNSGASLTFLGFAASFGEYITSVTYGGSYYTGGTDFQVGNAIDTGGDGDNSGAVPEPASWALMLGGFGLIGAAMRRRQRATALVA